MRDSRAMQTAAALIATLALSAGGAGRAGAADPRIELRPLAPAGIEATPPLPPSATYPVQLVLDDDGAESAAGVTVGNTAHQFLAFNRFTRPAGVDLFHLEQIWVLFPQSPGIGAGSPAQLVVYLDPDGNPANGANLLATWNVTVQAADNSTFSVYSFPPLAISGTGDVLIGVIDRFVATGVTPPTATAALDSTASQGRSWIAVWAADPPASPTLPPDALLTTVDAFGLPGNFMIRGFGTPAERGRRSRRSTLAGSPGSDCCSPSPAPCCSAVAARQRSSWRCSPGPSASPRALRRRSSWTISPPAQSAAILPGSGTSLASGGGILGTERDLLVSRASGSGNVVASVSGSSRLLGPGGNPRPRARGLGRRRWQRQCGESERPRHRQPDRRRAQRLPPRGEHGSRRHRGRDPRLLRCGRQHLAPRARAAGDRHPARLLLRLLRASRSTPATGANFAAAGAVTLRVTGTDSAVEGTIANAFGATRFETAVPNVGALKVDLTPAGAPLANASPGDTIRYRITITNTGATAQGVNLADTLDPNLTLVAGSLRTTPVARPDAYKTLPNTTLDSSAAGRPSLLANDSDADGNPVAAVAAAGQATLQGGSVTLGTNGHFVYSPPAGFTGPDSFSYTLQATPGDPTADAYGAALAPVTAHGHRGRRAHRSDPRAGRPGDLHRGRRPLSSPPALTRLGARQPTLTSATVAITNLLDAGAETLAANTGGTSITALYVAPTLTLTGPDTVANFQQVLRTVTYDNSSQNPNTTARSLDWVAVDPFGPGNPATSTVNIVPSDDPPVAVADTATVTEDSGASPIDVLANDTDVDGGPKSVASVTQPANGTVVITGGGTGLTYAPNADYCNNPPGTTLSTFTYTLDPRQQLDHRLGHRHLRRRQPGGRGRQRHGERGLRRQRDRRPRQRHRPRRRAEERHLGHPARQRHGGHHRRRHRPHLRAERGLLQHPAGHDAQHLHLHADPGRQLGHRHRSVTCVDDPPTAVADSATVDEDSGANAIATSSPTTPTLTAGRSARRLRHPAGQRRRGHHRRRHRPDLRTERELLQPAAGYDARHLHLHPDPGQQPTTVTVTVTCVDDNPVAGRTPPPWPRTPAPAPSTSSPTTPTSTAARRASPRSPSPPTAPWSSPAAAPA